jgi:hypothetical protein
VTAALVIVVVAGAALAVIGVAAVAGLVRLGRTLDAAGLRR